jgi:hypothetical protein
MPADGTLNPSGHHRDAGNADLLSLYKGTSPLIGAVACLLGLFFVFSLCFVLSNLLVGLMTNTLNKVPPLPRQRARSGTLRGHSGRGRARAEALPAGQLMLPGA